MNRTDVINFYFSKIKSPTYYLEIGVSDPNLNFNKIKADIKHGVDPLHNNFEKCFFMTSDGFFKINEEKYDLIFIDGYHAFEQSYKDFVNAEKCLKKDGIIIMHDCNPLSEKMQTDKRKSRNWTGGVWNTFIKLRKEREDLEMFTIDCDWGLGVIKKGKQKLLGMEIKDYKTFDYNRKEALNLISINEWRERESY